MKISESKIRKIIRESVLSEVGPGMGMDPMGATMPAGMRRDTYSQFPGIPDPESMSKLARAAWDLTKSEAKTFADDPLFYMAWVIDNIYRAPRAVQQFAEDQIDKIPGIENFPAWFALSLKAVASLSPAYKAKIVSEYDNADSIYNYWKNELERIKGVTSRVELGHPPGSTTEYIDNLNNKFTRSGEDFSSVKGKLLSSDQLATNSAEDAISLFYDNPGLGDSGAARDFNNESHPDFGFIKWGKTGMQAPGSGFAPQYIWLAKKLIDYKYTTFEKIYEILTKFEPPGAAEENVHPDGFVSPLYLAYDEAGMEARKILHFQKLIESEGDIWKFPVYRCDRDLGLARDTLASIRATDIPLVSSFGVSILGGDLESGGGYQDCFLVHYTDDPRFLIRRGSGRYKYGAMVFSLADYDYNDEEDGVE